MKKLMYLLIVIALPFFIASCGGGVAGIVDEMCACYSDAGIEKMEDMAELDEDKAEAFEKCMKEIAKKGEDLEEGLSDDEKEKMKDEFEEAAKNSDCKELLGF